MRNTLSNRPRSRRLAWWNKQPIPVSPAYVSHTRCQRTLPLSEPRTTAASTSSHLSLFPLQTPGCDFCSLCRFEFHSTVECCNEVWSFTVLSCFFSANPE